MSKSSLGIRDQKTSSSPRKKKESNGTTEMDDPQKTMSRVSQIVEQLHMNKSTPHEKELLTARLLGIAKARKEARSLIGSHGQAIPLLINILRTGTPPAKTNVAATLSVLCRDEDLKLKVLLGGSVPPLLSLLKLESAETRKVAAEALYEVSANSLSNDHVGSKIFVMEGVVPILWEQLNLKRQQDKVVEGFITGALRNLCGDKDGYWRATLDAGGVDIIVGLLSSGNAAAQANAASLLARLMSAFSDSIPKIIDSGAIKGLLGLLNQKNDITVRANAADALEVISLKSMKAKKFIVDAHGVPVLIGAVVAPSKESMQGEGGLALQRHATQALANINGGMSALILYLAELSKSPRLAAPVADIIGALAYALKVFEPNYEEEIFDANKIESVLVMLLKPRDNKVVQDRLLEAMANLYGDEHLAKTVDQSEAKKVLIGLIILASGDHQEYLILSVIRLCCDGVSAWEAIGKREGIQLVISFLSLSSELQQEYAIKFLSILTDQVDDCKWAITAAGGIPQLVHLLEMGSQKAREDAALMISNLCSQGGEIREVIKRAGAIPAFMQLLQNGGPKGQEASAKALIMLIESADSSTINQLLAMLLGDLPVSKTYVIKVLGHLLAKASDSDLVLKGSAANKGMRSLVQILNSSNGKTQEEAASVLTDLFNTSQEIRDSFATEEVVNSCIKLLESNTQILQTKPTSSLGAFPHPLKSKPSLRKSSSAQGEVKQLIKLAKTSTIDAAETAVAALANLISDPHVAAEALAEDIVSALSRVLGEGSVEGKRNAASAFHQLLRLFPVGEVFLESSQWQFVAQAVLGFLSEMDMDETGAADALEVVELLAGTKQGENSAFQLWSGLAEVPSSLEALVRCLTEGRPSVQDKAIEILSRLCADQPVALGNTLISKSRSIGELASRIMKSTSLEVRVGGTALLICAAKEHRVLTMDALDVSGYLKLLIYTLVDMIKQNSSCGSLEIEVTTPRSVRERSAFHEGDEFDIPDPATVLGGTVALWLLSIISSAHAKNKLTVFEAGGLEALSDRLAKYVSNPQAEHEDTEGIWISALLVAVLFQDANVVSSPTVMRFIPSLALLLDSDEMIDRFFAAQALASLVCHNNKKIGLAVANSRAISGLISLIGHIESDMPNIVALSEEFCLVRNPDQVVLERLFEIQDVRVGSITQKTIPLLVDLLRPIPDRPGAPLIAVRLLSRIAEENDANKLFMAEAGALDALSKYLSLSPQDLTEATISELLRIMFSNPDILQYEASINCMSQLVAVLHLGSRGARLSAAKALNELFYADAIKDSEAATQAVQPLADMLDSATEAEQHAALSALVKLISNDTNAALMADAEGYPIESLYRILSAASSLELKTDAAKLCFALFGNPKVREMPVASDCVEPLILIIQSGKDTAVEAGVCALEKLLDDEQQAELASAFDITGRLVRLVSGTNHRLIESSICALIKLGKDRTPRKLDMVNAGIIDNCIELLPNAPSSLCSAIAELFRILTNSSTISKSAAAAKIVEPLFMVLLRSDFSLWGQHSALQALVNILEKPQSHTTLKIIPSQVIEPLISFLESSSQAIQQLGTELLSLLLTQDHFKQDIITKNAIGPLVQLAGNGMLELQKAAIKALESISVSWPKAVVDAGGVFELSKVIVQDDPEPPAALWEAAAFILCNVLQSNTDCYFKVPVVALVKLLYSTSENIIILALNALIVQERTDVSSAEMMAEAGAIDALLDLLRSHQCEDTAGKLLEALFNHARVREMKVSRYAIAPLSQYLLDPQTRTQSGRFLAALALGDLSQHEGLARASDSVSACQALINLLEDDPSEEMKIVAICALQNFVMRSRTNRRAVAEAGGVLVIQELLLSPNPEITSQAALLIRFLFSNHTLQEYVSNELIRSLTAALEKEMSPPETIKEEVLMTIHVIFSNFAKVHMSEAATLCIPHLVAALKSGSEAAQDSVLSTFCLLKQSWSKMPADVSRPQAMVASEAIPILQMLMRSSPPSLHDRADSLLRCLPGCLTVTIKRANNLKQVMGGTNAFCRLTIGHGPSRHTKVISHSTSPEWKEGFTWAFDVPPKGQKLRIHCKSKNTFGKTSLGRVTIQIDKVVSEGSSSGLFSLGHDTQRDGSSRTIEIEITWSNRGQMK